MSFKCPHCGIDLEIIKSEDITKSKTVGQPERDLAGGIVDATSAAIEAKTAEVSKSSVINSLDSLNKLANASLGEENSGLASGWSGAMVGALKAKREAESGPWYSPEELVSKDPEDINKDAAAKTVQNLIHGALNKA